VIGPDGKPLKGAAVAGLTDQIAWASIYPSDTASHTIRCLLPGKGRTITAIHREKHLAGELILKGDEQGPVSVTLRPCGEVVGRIVDADGQPWTVKSERLQSYDRHPEDPLIGKDGRFRIEGLIPGRKYGYYVFIRGRHAPIVGDVFNGVSVKPGEVKDIGDVTPKPWQPK
jgi:hypothetical protein